jgi:hypothetical protein
MTLPRSTSALLARYGRPVTLRRRVGTTPAFTEVTVNGTLRGYSAQELQGGVLQGDSAVVLDAATGALGVPKRGDFLVVDGRTWAVQGAVPRALGAAVVGYDVWVRGG